MTNQTWKEGMTCQEDDHMRWGMRVERVKSRDWELWSISVSHPNPGLVFVYMSWKSSPTPKSTEQLFKDSSVRPWEVATARKLQIWSGPTVSKAPVTWSLGLLCIRRLRFQHSRFKFAEKMFFISHIATESEDFFSLVEDRMEDIKRISISSLHCTNLHKWKLQKLQQ